MTTELNLRETFMAGMQKMAEMQTIVAHEAEKEMASSENGKEIYAQYVRRVEEGMIKHAGEKAIMLRIEAKDQYMIHFLSQEWEKKNIKWSFGYIYADESKPIDIVLRW